MTIGSLTQRLNYRRK